MVHELTHFVENKKGYTAYQNSLFKSKYYLNEFLVKNNYSDAEDFMAKTIEEYKSVYSHLSKDDFNKAIQYEMLAKINEHLINEEPEALKRLTNKDTGLKAIWRDICEFFDEIVLTLNGESEKAYALKMARKFRELAGEKELYDFDGIRYSREELSELRIVDKKYKAMLKDFDDGKKSGYVFDLGNSPKWINNSPLSNKRIDLTPNIVEKAIVKHGIPLENLQNLVFEIQNPIMAFPSISENVPAGTQNIVVLTNIKNSEGLPVVCVIRLDQNNRGISVDRITSIQRKDNVFSFLERSIQEADNKSNYINGKKLLYINNKKATEWIAAIGLQLPKQAKLIQLLNNNISHQLSIVNNNSMQNQKKYSITSDTSNSQTVEKPEAQKRTMLISQTEEVAKVEDIRHRTAQNIFKEFSIPINQRTDVKTLINGALKKVEQGSNPSDIIAESLFSLLEKHSKVIDDNYYNQYKDLKELIRNTKLHFSEEVRKDFSEAESFRKSNMGRISLNHNEGRGIDDFYQELCNNYPDVFSDEIVNSADQLREIADVACSITKEELTVIEAGAKDGLTKEDFQLLIIHQRSDFIIH